ncbi:MAG: YitT family protein [Clostridiales bacterium]|nr:YitT family protein [Clostridiales bacterium]MCD7828606.1 YitT family protein [Clostridiales bacterium]
MEKTKKSKSSAAKEIILDIVICTAGSFIYALAVNCFVASNDISSGGITGLGILINYLWDLPIGASIFVLNVPLFIIAFIVLGWRFIVKTLFSTFLTSLFIDLGDLFMPSYSGDKLLAALFGGALMGIGLGIIFTRGSTSGGTDILSRLLKKKYPHLSMGRLMMVCDMCVALLAGLVYRNIESILYAVIVFLVSGRTIDFVLYGASRGKMMMIITSKSEEISKAITSETPRGVSILPVQGAYTGEERHMLLIVVRPQEVTKIRKIVKRYDEQPFIIISDASEILGLGFKSGDSDI